MQDKTRKDWIGVNDKAGNKYYMTTNDGRIDICTKDGVVHFSLPLDFPIMQIKLITATYLNAIERGIEIGKKSDNQKLETLINILAPLNMTGGEHMAVLELLPNTRWGKIKFSLDYKNFIGEEEFRNFDEAIIKAQEIVNKSKK